MKRWLDWLSACYWAPTLLAEMRQHPHARWIARVNRWAGWTGIGWLAALGWADPAAGLGLAAAGALAVVASGWPG